MDRVVLFGNGEEHRHNFANGIERDRVLAPYRKAIARLESRLQSED